MSVSITIVEGFIVATFIATAGAAGGRLGLNRTDIASVDVIWLQI
jgi:hypothetical protein